jgi:prophage antirepressor-like protein
MEIKIFEKHEFGAIRTFTDNGGKLWFCGSDVAKGLGYSNPRDAVRRHCRCVAKHDVPHPQATDKNIEMAFISEGDVYRLIAHSKLPNAERFESWVFDEVVPSVVKTGGYITGQEELSDADLMAKALLVAQKQIEQREQRINALETANKKLLPDAEYGRSLQSKHGITTTSIAKELGMSAVTLNKRLHELGVQYRQSGQWYLYRKYQDKGLTTTRTVPIVRFDGKPDVRRETLWTMAGHRFIRDLMTKTEEV